MNWLIAKNSTGTRLGSAPIEAEPVPEDPASAHALALTAEFRTLLRAHWPGCSWIMLDTSRFVIYRADSGVLGVISLSQSPE